MMDLTQSLRTARAAVLSAFALALCGPVAHAQAGAYDATFDGDGVATTVVGDLASAARVLALPDGRVLLAGFSGSATASDVALVRYTASGALDPLFGGGDGIATADLAGNDFVNAAAVQPDGKIVVVGYGTPVGFTVARFNVDGTLDTSFGGGDGWLTTAFGTVHDEATDVAVQPDGRIVVVGHTARDAGYADVDWAVARYTATGVLDTSFDTDGMVTVDVAGLPDYAFGVALQGDGRIVVAGSAITGATEPITALRLTATGGRDASFGTNGLATLDVTAAGFSHATTFDVAIAPGGAIVLAGAAWATNDDPAIAVARMTAAGAPDGTFGTGGLATVNRDTRTCAAQACEQANAVLVQPDGRVVTAGFVATTASAYEQAVARFGTDGTLDTTFDGDGVFQRASDGGVASGVALQADGKILVAGGAGTAFSALRLTSGIATSSPTATTTIAGAGWRLLAPPVTGLTVGTLAGLNLVQGLPDEFPGFGVNLFTGYTGGAAEPNGGFAPPSAKATPLQPGRGFFWHFYTAGGPAPGDTRGVSRRAPLPLTLTATAPAVTADLSVAFADNADVGDNNFHMLGNPFAAPLQVSGISATGGVLQGGVVQTYDPASGYVVRMPSAVLSVWQGFFAELTPTVAGAAVTVAYDYESTQPGATPPLYGRSAAVASATPMVQFGLSGMLASGTPVADGAAVVRFDADADAGWDALDASKLTPLASDYAVVAPVVERDGEAVQLAVDTRPAGAETQVGLAFASTGAGAFTLSWALAGDSLTAGALPDGWRAELRDLATGSVVDLSAEDHYDFDAEAGDWAGRFALVVTPRGAVAGESPAGPRVTALTTARPNPTAGRTVLGLTVDAPQHVRAMVYDALGRAVAVVLDADVAEAVDVTVDASRLATGVYVVRVEGTSFSLARRITVTR